MGPGSMSFAGIFHDWLRFEIAVLGGLLGDAILPGNGAVDQLGTGDTAIGLMAIAILAG